MSRLPKGDNESALLSTQLHVIDNPGNKEHWGDQPIVFPSPADGKSINSFGPRTPPARTKPGQLERIMTRKTIYSVGSPQNIQLAKMDRVEHPIIGVDNFRPIISFEIKVARYPLRSKLQRLLFANEAYYCRRTKYCRRSDCQIYACTPYPPKDRKTTEEQI